MSIEHDEQVAAYGQWVVEYVNRGWEADLLSFMFNPISGPKAQRGETMDREIMWVYSRCLERMFRRPRLKLHQGWLPIWIISPDWPVPKADKDHYRDIVINDGEHRHAVALTPPRTRLKTSFNDYVTQEQWHFTGRDRTLWRIDAQPITNAAEYATAYALKSVERGRISPGEVFVLPRSRSEL
jgi:hypothetical protein